MANQKQPTKSELAILSVLWDKDKATVREIFESLGSEQRGGYTTVLKLLQIMYDKGLVGRDESQKAHVYFPKIRRGEAASGLLGDVVDKVFGGSTSRLVQTLLDESTTPDELQEIRRVIDEAERREGGTK